MSFIVQPQTLFAIGPSRSFAGIKGYCIITENATDAIEITQQPVQQGASIADHAFKKPGSFSMQIQFQASLFGQSLAQIYQSLLTLQSSLQPFDVITPKRTYSNMLFASLGQTTDKKTENVLSIAASFQEVILVPVLATNVPRSQLRNPGANAGTQAVGKKSALLSLAQGIGAVP